MPSRRSRLLRRKARRLPASNGREVFWAREVLPFRAAAPKLAGVNKLEAGNYRAQCKTQLQRLGHRAHGLSRVFCWIEVFTRTKCGA